MPDVLYETSRGIQSIPPEDILLKNRTLFLTEDVSSQSCTELIKNLLLLDEEDQKSQITLCIHSNGGSVSSGLALYDVLQLIHAPVRTVCLGMAASMGAILFLAGKKREMLPHARIMIHDPSYANGDIAGRKPAEIQRQLDELKRTRDILADIIAKATGKTLEEICSVTCNDTYFNAEEAIDYKLATGIAKSI